MKDVILKQTNKTRNQEALKWDWENTKMGPYLMKNIQGDRVKQVFNNDSEDWALGCCCSSNASCICGYGHASHSASMQCIDSLESCLGALRKQGTRFQHGRQFHLVVFIHYSTKKVPQSFHKKSNKEDAIKQTQPLLNSLAVTVGLKHETSPR